MVVASSQGGRNTATSELTSYTTNGLYYCSANELKAYFSVYSMNSGKRADVANYIILKHTHIVDKDIMHTKTLKLKNPSCIIIILFQ